MLQLRLDTFCGEHLSVPMLDSIEVALVKMSPTCLEVVSICKVRARPTALDDTVLPGAAEIVRPVNVSPYVPAVEKNQLMFEGFCDCMQFISVTDSLYTSCATTSPQTPKEPRTYTVFANPCGVSSAIKPTQPPGILSTTSSQVTQGVPCYYASFDAFYCEGMGVLPVELSIISITRC